MPQYEFVDHPLFPANSASGLPRVFKIIDAEPGGSGTQPRICDIVVTFLHNLSDTAVEKFFNPDVTEFRVTGVYVEARGAQVRRFCIWRGKDRVICAFFEPVLAVGGVERWRWHFLTRSHLTEVAPRAEWQTFYGAERASTSGPAFQAVLGTEEFNVVSTNQRASDDPEEILYVTRVFGDSLCSHAAWDLLRVSKLELTVTEQGIKTEWKLVRI